MRFLLVTCLAVARIMAASPKDKLPNISVEQTVTNTEPTTIITTEGPKADKTTDTTENEPIDATMLTGKERKSLIGHISLNTAENLFLTPRQQMAVTQELEYQQLGLQPFSDPTPWQRLTREEQQTFNNVYLALPADIQEFSKVQFLTVPDDIKEHAFRMFLNLDIETLIYVIGKELQNEQEIGQQPMNETKQYTDDDKLPITNEQILEKKHVEKHQEISSEDEKQNVHPEEAKEITVAEEEAVKEELELEGEQELKKENKAEKAPKVKEKKRKEGQRSQELEQTVDDEPGSGVQEDQIQKEAEEIAVAEEEAVKEELELEGEQELKKENKADNALKVKEKKGEEGQKSQELDQRLDDEQGSGLQEDQIQEDEKAGGDKEKLKEVIQFKKEELSSNKIVDSAPVESSTNSNKQKHIQNAENVREVAAERLNKEIVNSPDFSFEAMGVPFLPRRQEPKKKTNIQYQARRHFVEKIKQILTEEPRGSLRSNVGRSQPLKKQRKIYRRGRLPQRRTNLIDLRKQRQTS